MTDEAPRQVTEVKLESSLIKGKMKLGLEFNKAVTRQTLAKKLPQWEQYTWANIAKLRELIAVKKAEYFHTHPHQDRLRHMRQVKGAPDPSPNFWLDYSIEALRSLFVLKPCLIVGYGNSFHETVDMIHELPREKINIICTDRPLRKLIEHKVVPDLVVNLDSGPQIKPFYDIDLDDGAYHHMKAALAITTDPGEWKWFRGQKYWYIPAVTPYKNDITKRTRRACGFPIIPTAGNVGTTGMIIGKVLGARPLVLVGMDFGRELTSGDPLATDDKLSCAPGELKIEVKGRSFTSDPVLHAYAFATKQLLLLYDIPVMNISGGIMHGKWMQTITPLPRDGGTSRDRMQNFITQIRDWPVPPEATKFRSDFEAGKITPDPRMFLPQIRDPATIEDEILLKQVREVQGRALAPANGRTIMEEA